MGAVDSTEASEIIYKLYGFLSHKKLYLIVKYLPPKIWISVEIPVRTTSKRTHSHTHSRLSCAHLSLCMM